MKRSTLENAKRAQLVEWLEGTRGFECYDDESTSLLRKCALEDFDDCAEEEGFYEAE